jgi:Tol biopolymer transport system component
MREQITRQRFDAHDPFWSPDGTRIYFHSLARDREGLWSISPAGGQAELVVEGATRAAISPDGGTLAMLLDESGEGARLSLWFSSPSGAERRQYTRPPFDEAFFAGLLRFSPDGSNLLLWLRGGFQLIDRKQEVGFWMIPLPVGEPRRVLPSLAGGRRHPEFAWLPNSQHIVVIRDDGPTPGWHLWLADVDADAARPLTITNSNEGSPAVSADGRRVAFTSEATDFDLALVPLDGGPLRPFLSSTRNEQEPAWSPTGAQYAFATDRTGSQQIWLRSQQGDWERPLVTDADFGGSRTMMFSGLAFSPDGRRLAYSRSVPEEGGRIWISTLAGGSPVRLLDLAAGWADVPTWSPDGNWLAFVTGVTPTQLSLAKTRVGAGSAPPVVLKGGILSEAKPEWSPDGAWILYQSTEGLTVISPDGQNSRVVSESAWVVYAWAANSTDVYGLQLADNRKEFMFVKLDVRTGREHVINRNLGAFPLASRPILGFSRVGDRSYATSIARARSDIWLLDGFSLPTGFGAWFRSWR